MAIRVPSSPENHSEKPNRSWVFLLKVLTPVVPWCPPSDARGRLWTPYAKPSLRNARARLSFCAASVEPHLKKTWQTHSGAELAYRTTQGAQGFPDRLKKHHTHQGQIDLCINYGSKF